MHFLYIPLFPSIATCMTAISKNDSNISPIGSHNKKTGVLISILIFMC